MNNEHGEGKMEAGQSTLTTPVADPSSSPLLLGMREGQGPTLAVRRGHVTSSGQRIMSRGDICHF